MNKLFQYINPLARIGKRKYSVLFPLTISLLIPVLSEIYSHFIARNPDAVGAYIIFINVAAIIYFAFRDGIRGGLIAVLITLGYYVYIIYSRQMSDEEMRSALAASISLGGVYFLLALVIGWLKQTIDKLIEREANERRRLLSVIEQLPVGIIITDEKGNITQANKKVSEILGRKVRKDSVAGKDTIPNALYKGKPVKPNQWPLAQTLQTGKPVVEKEIVIIQKNGKNITTQISAAAIKNSDDEVIAAATIMNDISGQKEAERQKDEFIGIASHELKTPVTSIKAYAQVLKFNFVKSGDKKSADSLEKMDTQLNKLTDLIGDLLDVTKMESGQIQFNEEVFDFDELVKEQVDQLQLTTTTHVIVLKCKTNKVAFGDRERIGQVITNLISNAIKYSPRSKKIIVTGSVQNGKSLQLCVQDFGIGMSKKNTSKVFERFYRVDKGRSRDQGGTGLGLAIVKHIMISHNGKVELKSQLGQGSEFICSFPPL